MKIRFIKPTAIFAAILVTIGFCHSEALDPNSFTRRMPITFSGYSGEASLTNFPVLVKFSEGITEFSYDDFSAGGTNLRFADNSGQALDYEIDNWDTDGTSTVWVRVPSLTANAVVWAYWGGTLANHAPSTTNGAVWGPSSHTGVWHFNTLEDGFALDSTSNNLHAVVYQPNVSTTRVDGVIGNCALNSDSGTGSDGAGFITPKYNHLGVGNTFTISGWCRHIPTGPSWERVFSHKNANADWNGFETELSNNNTGMAVRGGGPTVYSFSTPNIANNQWYYLTFIFNGTTFSQYFNGAFGSSGTIEAAADNTHGLSFGVSVAKTSATYKGSFDEFRLRDSISTPDWIAAEYATVKNENFASYGAIETIETDLPLLGATLFDTAAFHSASFTYTLLRLGSNNPDVSIAYGTAPGVYTHTNLVASGASSTGTFTHTLTPLTCATTYYGRFIASNASGTVEAFDELVFTTPGEPLMGDNTMTADGSTLSISGALTDIGVSDTTVELWFGTSPEALYKIDEWPALSTPQSFSKTMLNQTLNTYYSAFRAYNVCNGVTNETWTEISDAAVFGDLVWTGNAGDNSWNNPQNWNPMVVPGSMDTAVFTDSGIPLNAVIRYNANQHVRKVVIQTATAFTFGHADDVTAGYSLTVTDLDRVDVPGTEGLHEFQATVKLAPDADGNATWTIDGESQLRMNALLDSTAPTTFVKMGTGNFTMFYRSPVYAGPWNIVEGSVHGDFTRSLAYNEDGTMKGAATIGGTDVPASLVNSRHCIYSGMVVTVLTNGTFSSGDSNAGRVQSVHVKEGGKAVVSGTYFYCYLASLTGGTIDGPASANFFRGGYTQGIRSYSSPQTAYYNIGMTLSSYYDAYIIVEDGPPAIDLDMTLGSLRDPAREVRKQGAGTVVFGKASSHSNDAGVTALGFVIQGGRAIFNNPTGSGTGKNRTQVNGGAIIGGTGFLGGDSAHTNYNVLVQGGSTSSLASVEPGSVDAVTGASLIGTLTVGSATTTNKVTFGNHSRLNMQIGPNGEADKLMVHGPLDLSSTSDGISLYLDPDAKAGTYVLAEAAEGITGTFNVMPQDFPKPARLKYTATTVEYTVPAQATLILLR